MIGSTPTRISFPAQGVDAPVVPVATSAAGSLDLPDDPRTIGWWVGGAAPGAAAGNVVLAGHVDSHRLGIGTFAVLRSLDVGDSVVVTDALDGAHPYRVVARRQLSKADLPAELFDQRGVPGLVLITCGGRFDPHTRHYDDNVIVVAEPAT
jgi:hypothetical protein